MTIFFATISGVFFREKPMFRVHSIFISFFFLSVFSLILFSFFLVGGVGVELLNYE